MKTELSKEDLEKIVTINESLYICLNIPTKEDIERRDRQIKLLEEYEEKYSTYENESKVNK